ncbi:hypothetical protein CRBSH125_07980 [Afipia carboxidovorans]|nr:hypothetical protein CRBSH125_07980 [Afipia carboxidovorans]
MVLPHIPPMLTRLRVKPDEPSEGPPAINGPRPQGLRRPHTDRTVAAVRLLVETTGLSYREIGAKVGIPASNITGWKRDGGWQRPPHAPRHKDMIPTARAGRRLKLRRLAERLRALAERAVRELEDAPHVDLEALMQALQLLKMARLEVIGGYRRRKSLGLAETGQEWRSREEAIRTALKQLHRGGVEIDRAPQEALDLVIDANLPVEPDHPALRERGK